MATTQRKYKAKVHITMDYETLSLNRHAAIVEIGAVVTLGNFDYQTFECKIKPSSYEDTPFVADLETVAWHNNQHPDYLASCEAEGITWQEAAVNFHSWLSGFANEAELHVWAQGKDFDGPLTEHLFAHMHLETPYKYYNLHCARDLIWLNPAARIQRASDGTKHTALADAQHTSEMVRSAVARSTWYQKLFA